MKRIFFCIATIICTFAVHAQIQQQFGFLIGAEGDLLRKNSQIAEKTLSLADNLYGPKIGLAYEVDFYKGLGMFLGVNYSFGTQIRKSTPSVDNDYELRTTTFFHSISVPVNLQYRYLLAQNTWISIYTGPLLQSGIKMQQIQTTEQPLAGLEPTKTRQKDFQYTYDYFVISDQANLNKFSDADGDRRHDYNRFNLMWSLGMSFQFHQFFIRGGYSWGIVNQYYDITYTNLNDQNSEWKRRLRHDEWSVSIGWYFAYTKHD